MPKPANSELKVARDNSVNKLLLFLGVLIMYLIEKNGSDYAVTINFTYTTKAQKIMKAASRKQDEMRKKCLGCTGGKCLLSQSSAKELRRSTA